MMNKVNDTSTQSVFQHNELKILEFWAKIALLFQYISLIFSLINADLFTLEMNSLWRDDAQDCQVVGIFLYTSNETFMFLSVMKILSQLSLT